MTKQEKIDNISKKLRECRKELEQIRDDISYADRQKVKASITSSISFLNRASKQLSDMKQLEGQMNLFDYLDEDGDFDLSDENLDF